MFTNEAGTHELMINTLTGEMYQRELSKEDQAWNIIYKDECLMSAESKVEKLTALGYELEQILEMAFEAGKQQQGQ